VKKKKEKPKIKPDMKILLEIERKSNDGITRNVLSLGSYVEEVISDNFLLIKMPIHRGYNYLLPRDKPILAYFFIANRMFSLTFQFQDRVARDGLEFARVRILSELQPDQRRDCYRLQCSLPVTVERVAKKRSDPPPPVTCEMLNFSDGGMLFAVNEEMEMGENMTLSFDIGTAETVKAKVLRIETPTEGIYRHNIAVKFLHKCIKQKQRFYRFIVAQQREKLKQQQEAAAAPLDGL